MVTQLAFRMKLHAGMEEEYQRRHDAIWPNLQALLKETGISNYRIFLDPDTLYLFSVLEIDDPALLDQLPRHPVMIKWWFYMKDIMDTNEDNSPVSIPLKQVFYLP